METAKASPSSVSPKTISDLPRLPLLTIFDNIPLLNLLHIDEVCRAWKELKSEALFRRKQLILAHSNDEIDMKWIDMPCMSTDMLRLVKNDDGSFYCKAEVCLDRHALYYDFITPMMVDKVIELMPNLKILYIVQRGGTFPDLWKIKLLLHHYRYQLKRVKIVFFTQRLFDEKDLNEIEMIRCEYQKLFPSIFRTLNSMTKLTSLEMYLTLPDGLGVPIEVDLSVAGQLKKLHVYTSRFTDLERNVDVMKHTCEKYAEKNEDLRELYIPNRHRLDTLLAFGPRVSTALRAVYFEDWVVPARLENFKKFAQKYSNIEDLSIAISALTVAQVAEALLPCKNLVHLSIDMCFDQELIGVAPVENNLPAGQQMPVLPSVRSLILIIITSSHRNLEKLNLDVIFPNVQVIELSHDFDRCTDCSFRIPEGIMKKSAKVQTAYGKKVHKCMRLARAPFSRFSKLTALHANVGLKKVYPEISLSYKKEVHFTLGSLNKKTFFY